MTKGATVTVTKIRIGGKMFILDPGEDVEALEQSIAAAAAAGSGFVRFATAGHVVVSALVTPHLPVRISRIDNSTAQQSGPADPFMPDDAHLGSAAHFDE